MADILHRQDLNKQVHTAGERTLANSGVRGLVASDLPASETIGTLSKRVRQAKTRTERYNYWAANAFIKNMYFDGLVDVNYSEMGVSDSTLPYVDAVIGDFNASTNEAVRFTYEATTQNNVKTKILNEVLMNFKTTPGDAITSIYKSTENINKEQSLRYAKQVWDELAGKAVSVVLPVGTPDIAIGSEATPNPDSVAKAVYTQFIDWGKNSKAHVGVGTDPAAAPGVITKGTDSVSPTLKFDSSEFWLLTSPEYQANITFDGERTFFNWGAGQMEIYGQQTLYIDDEEMSAAAATAFANSRVILVHKDAVFGVQDWEGTGVANAGKLYQTFHNYMKQDAYPMYDAPVVSFEVSAVKKA